MSDVRTDYYHWLLDIIDVNQEHKSYYMLVKDLHNTEFIWSVPNDDNRADDGEKMRAKFSECSDHRSFRPLEAPCSMLEMLVGLAERISFIMDEVTDEQNISKWFWLMMNNCDLDKFTDEDYVDLGGYTVICKILNRIMHREYQKNGIGGLFPLRMSKVDQRKVEIWYQMSQYLDYNYYSGDRKV